MTPGEAKSEERLIEAIDRGNCVAFVGAGFSAPVIGGWEELLTLLSEAVEDAEVAGRVRSLLKTSDDGRPPDNMDFEAAAQLLEDACEGQPRSLGELVKEVISAKKQEASAQRKELVRRRVGWLERIPFRAVLTTNFDGYLGGEPPSPEVYARALRPDLLRYAIDDQSLQVPVINLHGSLDDPSSIVMTRQAYRRRLHDEAKYRRFLGTLFCTTTVLYLGFSFTDAYINELRSEVLSLLGAEKTSDTAYAMLTDVPAPRREFLQRHERIGVFQCTKANGFVEFDRFLERLADQTQPGARLGRMASTRSILWMDPNPASNAPVTQAMGDGLVQCSSVTEALEHLEAQPFDLVLTRLGYRQDHETDQPRSEAEALLLGMKRPEHGAPVIVFGDVAPEHAEANKRRLLQAGAVAYTYTWDGLFAAAERVLSSGPTTA